MHAIFQKKGEKRQKKNVKMAKKMLKGQKKTKYLEIWAKMQKNLKIF